MGTTGSNKRTKLKSNKRTKFGKNKRYQTWVKHRVRLANPPSCQHFNQGVHLCAVQFVTLDLDLDYYGTQRRLVYIVRNFIERFGAKFCNGWPFFFSDSRRTRFDGNPCVVKIHASDIKANSPSESIFNHI